MPRASDRRAWNLSLGVALGGIWAVFVASFLLPLALRRLFHIDEVQVAYNAALLGWHRLPSHLNFPAPFLVPLSWIASRGDASWPRLIEMRLAFFVLFLAVLALIARVAPRVHGIVVRAAVLIGITMVEPLWRHGFEIRHDLLQLAGSLILFGLCLGADAGKARDWHLLLAGAIAALMQMNSFKSLLDWGPGLALLLLVHTVRRNPGSLARRSAWIGAGLGAGLLVGFGILAAGGIVGVFLARQSTFRSYAANAERFAIGDKLVQLGLELPHLVALAALSAGWAILAVRRRRWRDELPSLITSAWLLAAVLALHINPTPFPYNFVHVIPFLFLAAIDGLALVARFVPALRAAAIVTFAVATLAALHFDWRSETFARLSSSGQRAYVEAVEALTSPLDPVLDGAGLVLSRRPPGPQWMLHSLTRAAYLRGELPTFRSMLAEDPAPALLTNYRWKWLGRADRRFIGEHYFTLAPRLLVLGGLRSETGGQLEILRAGRYQVRQVPEGPDFTFDESPLPAGGVLSLRQGTHVWRGSGLVWFWVGESKPDALHDFEKLPNTDLFVLD